MNGGRECRPRRCGGIAPEGNAEQQMCTSSSQHTPLLTSRARCALYFTFASLRLGTPPRIHTKTQLGTPDLYTCTDLGPSKADVHPTRSSRLSRTSANKNLMTRCHKGIVHPAAGARDSTTTKENRGKPRTSEERPKDTPSYLRPRTSTRWRNVRVITSTTKRALGSYGAHCGMRTQTAAADALAPIPLANGLKPRNVEPLLFVT